MRRLIVDVIRFGRKDRRGVDLISDRLPFGQLWYGEPNAVSNAIGYAMRYSRSANAIIHEVLTARREFA
jgi:hypothetical protein